MSYQEKLLKARLYYESMGYKGREAADLAASQLEYEFQEENLESFKGCLIFLLTNNLRGK